MKYTREFLSKKDKEMLQISHRYAKEFLKAAQYLHGQVINDDGAGNQLNAPGGRLEEALTDTESSLKNLIEEIELSLRAQ